MTLNLLSVIKQRKNILYQKETPLQTQAHPLKHSFEKIWSFFTGTLAVFALILLLLIGLQPVGNIISPLVSPLRSLSSGDVKKGHEVFGFAPWWNKTKLETTDFSVLTTFAYFGIPVDAEGNFVEDDPGYSTFVSNEMTQVFRKAHAHGTRVVLTVTQMDNDTIDEFLSSKEARTNAVAQIVAKVKERGIDGINVDYEYIGNPGEEARNNFTSFITDLTNHMHESVPYSRVTISVYASSAKGMKLYDIPQIAHTVDGIFMMAYDFAVTSSDYAQPTAPLYGYKEGKFAYDVSTAIDDFLKVMPADKLIMGIPWYGYNYVVYTPEENAQTLPYYSWKGKPTAQTYAYAKENITATAEGIDEYKTGWDDVAKVGWKAYHIASTNTWRMIYLDDAHSMRVKYDFAKSKNLQGVGMWALGNDADQGTELWAALREKFGEKLADNRIVQSRISE